MVVLFEEEEEEKEEKEQGDHKISNFPKLRNAHTVVVLYSQSLIKMPVAS